MAKVLVEAKTFGEFDMVVVVLDWQWAMRLRDELRDAPETQALQELLVALDDEL